MRELRSHGVTLVELLIVISILGIVAMAAIPFLPSAVPPQLETDARGFAGAIRFARSEAIRTGIPHGFSVDTAQQRLSVFRADMSSNPPTPVYDVYNPISKQLYVVSLASEPYAVVDTVSRNALYQGTCSATGDTLFDSRGKSYCRDPWPVLLRNGSLTLSSNGYQRRIVLDGITGRVTLQ